MDKEVRSRIQKATQAARALLEQEFAEQLEGVFDIRLDGTIAAEAGSHLDPAQRVVRGKLVAAVEHHRASGQSAAEAVARYRREVAFTTLNRFVALKMLEARGLVQECISRGEQSSGFKEFCGLAPGLVQLSDRGYRLYIESLFDELSVQVRVLFNRRDAGSLLWPKRATLEGLLAVLNAPDLAGVWGKDETIGWLYQYYNDEGERKQMREESSAPRNSRELAVRNQFFTPRYVVEFLTDNTLGRLWYEMTRGQTRLKEQCRYLVRRPNEIFLAAIEPCYRFIYGSDAEVPPDIFDYDAFAALYQGNFTPAAEGKSGFLALGAGALSTESIEAIIGEKWEQHGNECLDDLTRAIGQGLAHPRKNDLPWVWAALSQYVANSQIGSPYAKDTTRAFDELFRSLLRQHLESTSQEDLLKQPVFIPYRPLKDPRTILMLDPACGSMHFGLYAFDLFEVIYDEAWTLEEKLGADALSRPPGMKSLHATYAGKAAFLKDAPRLIIEHNLHGIDIDRRAVQIAGLSLWLRAHRAWHQGGVKPADRPRIAHSNLVGAEPMPGEKELLREFVEQQFPAVERPAFTFLLDKVFDRMTRAGDAGSLLRIEEEIRDAIAEARTLAREQAAPRQFQLFPGDELPDQTELDLRGLNDDERFWQAAEQRIYEALNAYAERAENGSGFRRRLFADDAAQGFAFIDLCRRRYDVVVMNPPFGAASEKSKTYIAKAYPRSKNDLLAACVERGVDWLLPGRMLGAITSRTAFFLTSYRMWREGVVLGEAKPTVMADLGYGVMDAAMVEAAAYVLRKQQTQAA